MTVGRYIEPHAGQPVLAVGTVRRGKLVVPAKVVQGQDGFPHVLRFMGATGHWVACSQGLADSFEADETEPVPGPTAPDYKALYEGLRARIEREIIIAEAAEVHQGCVLARYLKDALKGDR